MLCFDEVDKLSEPAILYAVLEDLNKKSLLLITNDEAWFGKVDERIRSRMVPEHLEFEPYTFDETRGILHQRTEYAFVPGVWDADALDRVAERTFELEDIRSGLFLLREAGSAAEAKASRKILPAHADQALAKLKDFTLKNPADLDAEAQFLLHLVKDSPDPAGHALYEAYKKKYDKSYKTFQRKARDLERAGLLIIEEGTSEQGGVEWVLRVRTGQQVL